MKSKTCLLLMSIITCAAIHASAFTVTLSASQTGPLCQYATVDFSANITDPNNYSKTAVWKVDGVPVATTGPNTSSTYFVYPNAGSFSYAFVNAGSHTVTCEVSSPSYNSGNPVVSNTLLYSITQNEPPQVVIVDLFNGSHYCIGALDVFTATPLDAGNPTYDWYVDANPPVPGTNVFNYVTSTAGVHVVFCVAHSSQVCDSLAPVSNPEAYSNTIIVNVDSCTIGVNEINSLGSSVSVYPNPVTNQLAISSKQFAIKEIEIYDVLGNRWLKTEGKGQNKVTLNVSELANGIYFVKVRGEKGGAVAKFVKQ